MTRVKGGVKSKRRHNKILKLAKGYRMTRSRLISKATEAVLHAGEYAFAGRKDRKSDFRRLWIVRINAALSPLGIKYNQFIHQMQAKGIELDRKILAQLAVEKPAVFEKVVEEVKK